MDVYSKMQARLWLILGTILVVSIALGEASKKISVVLSQRKPFVVIDQNGPPKGLDVSIVENFANTFNLQINYLIVNMSMNYAFVNEDNFERFHTEIILR